MRILRRQRGLAREHRPRHSEVDQERATRLEPNNQILATAIHRRDPLALELARHVVRVERARQPRIGDSDPLQAPPFECRREAQPDPLDLGQFWHDPTVASGYLMTSSRTGRGRTGSSWSRYAASTSWAAKSAAAAAAAWTSASAWPCATW